MLVVEVSFKLEKDFTFYDKMLKQHNLENCFNCITHYIYCTNRNLNNLTENEIKNACVRIRIVNNNECKVENHHSFNELKNISFNSKVRDIEKVLINKKFNKGFDTVKSDYHYDNTSMNSRIQIQEIKNIGLLVYYDNSNYYDLPFVQQRKKLIDDLNEFGFNFKYNDLCLDKLRILYYGKNMYNDNQNVAASKRGAL